MRKQKVCKPKFLSYEPNEKPSCSRKSKVRHLPFAITLLAKEGSMMEELRAEDEDGVSSRAFVLRSCIDSLGGRFPKEVLGAIFGLTRFLPKI